MASKLDHDKPLPTLPKRHDTPKLTTLSVEARNHTRRFILRAIEEESLAIAGNDWDHDNEAWTDGILDALDSLGDSIADGGWIAGANRSRRALIQRKLTSRGIEEGTTTADAVAEPKSVALSDVPEHTTEHSPPRSPAGTAMEGISFWVAKTLPPSPKPYAKHMLLTAAAYGSVPDNASDFEIVPSAIGCVFSPSRFTLPRTTSREEGIVLYGLDEWDANADYSDKNPIKIVGGNFSLQGVASLAQHAALCKVLRLSIYIYLSVVIEQHLFFDSRVKLNIPKVRPRPAPLPIRHFGDSSQVPNAGERSSDRSPHAGVWGFLSKKTGGLLTRATTLARHGSLDLRRTVRDTPRRSMDAPHPRGRRLSFLADGLPWQTKATKPTEQRTEDHPFRMAVTRIEGFQDLLSTTTGICFPPPPLLQSIAEREDLDPSRRLNPDERIRLHCLLGWEGRDAHAKGMIGVRGFVRQQEICALYSEHVLPIPVTRTPSIASTNSDTLTTNSSSLTSTSQQPAPALVPTLCGGRRRWMRFRYYSREDGADKTLGGAIIRMATTAEDQCGNAGCQSKRFQHELDFVHGGIRITVNINSLEEIVNEERVDMWQSCVECSARTKAVRMSDGTFLLSFGKFLELLVYSRSFHIITPPLCEHTVPAEVKMDALPSHPGLNIARHFTYRTHRITFTLAAVEEIYNVEVPRVQFVHGAHMLEEPKPIAGSPTVSSQCPTSSESESSDVRRILKREIRSWWHALFERMDNLEQISHDDTEPLVPLKSLPRIPSSVDPDEDEETESSHSSQATPKIAPSTLPGPPSVIEEQEAEVGSVEGTPRIPAKTLPTLPDDEPNHEMPSATTTIPEQPDSPSSRPPTERSDSKLSAKSASSASTRTLPKIPHHEETLQLLQNLREDLQREEHSLYSLLAKTPNECLNNARHAFKTSAKGALKRMSAWEGKHCAKGTIITSPYPENPYWWINGNHAVPGSNILINESDWGSMIAFTLSSGDYLAELASMSAGRSMTLEQPTTPQMTVSRPSLFSRSSYRLFGPSRQQPDPDDGHAVWEEPEVYSAIVSRKEHPRDPSSILSIRDVLRKAPVDTASMLSPSRLSSASLSRTGAPPSAWSKPAVEINTQPVDGEVVPPENDGAAGQILQEVEAATDERGLSRNNTITEATYGSSTSNSSVSGSTIRRGKASSILSTIKDDDVDGQTGGKTESSADGGSSTTASEQGDDHPPQVPPKPTQPETSAHPSHSAVSGFSAGIALVMKQILNTGESTPPPVPRKNHHGLLSLEPSTTESRPHIKYDWTIGKRLKFSCTVYYAKQFDLLRKRCGIEATYLRSIEKSANWLAEGGKSKSNFWKTSDDRFIIKTLVDAWNVADLQVLIELGPSYFKYIESTSNNPTVLAKLLGFYTIEIRNIESGTIQAKADLLVMENLFFNKKIAKTFDLKGIQGRKVKPTTLGNASKPLFDGDWIEGQRRALMLLHPHSKLVLQEAIKNDSEFLSKSNIMDYSLLLGIDAERKQIACGLVDTIGNYTFAKTLEYKAKQNLKSGKEVTVIPPNEYQTRFVNAMDGYFLACPDKWSKAPHDQRDYSDPIVLRSVL